MNKEQIEYWYNLNIDTKNRTLYFGTWNNGADLSEERHDWEVDDWSAQNIIKGLYTLDKLRHSNINVIWFSYGGDWNAGMAIYDFIKKLNSSVTMKCFGRVRSMGTVILQACKKRILSSHCEFMIHYGTALVTEVHEQDFHRFDEELKKNTEIMKKIYLKRIREKHKRYTMKKIEDLLTYDKFFTAQEAIELGLADKIL